MRRTHLMILMATFLSLALVSVTTAQMMGGDHNHASMGKADTPSQSGMMDQGMMNQSIRNTPADTLINNMSMNYNMMSGDFDRLQVHFNKMMQINDIKKLKAEMKKHQDLMQSMHLAIMKQKSMYQNMMSMMNSGEMDKVMQMHSQESESSAEYSHNH